MSRQQRADLRVLVLGCGSIGRRHIGNLLQTSVKDLLGYDPQPERRMEAESLFGIATVKALEDAWDWQPDVGVIATPTALHASLALQAARRGCDLLIEKPLAHKLDEDVQELLHVAQEQELVTLVGCNMRFHPGLMKVKGLVEEGAIGRVVAVRVEVGQYLPDWHPWEDYRRSYSARRELGGGIILDAIQELDYVRWMLGEVEAVACFAGKLSHLEIDTEDTAAVLLRFANGAIAEVHMDYVQRAYSRNCQVIGDEGTICWDYVTDKVRSYSAVRQKWQSFGNPPDWESNQMYLDEMRHFLRCLAGEELPMLDVFEAAQVLEIALAAKVSAEKEQIIRLREYASRE